MQNGTPPPPPVFVKCPRFETLWTRKNGFRECVCLSVCLSVDFSFVSTITFETIDRLDWPLVQLFSVKKWRSSSLASHFFPMVLVLSITDGFYRIEKSIFRANYVRYEKMLRSKIIHLKETYKFCFDHFLIKRTVLILIKKICSLRSHILIARDLIVVALRAPTYMNFALRAQCCVLHSA